MSTPVEAAIETVARWHTRGVILRWVADCGWEEMPEYGQSDAEAIFQKMIDIGAERAIKLHEYEAARKLLADRTTGQEEQ